MKFERKKYYDCRMAIISEKPMYASRLEERISAVLPAIESRVDSFEDYLSAYEHCSDQRTIGLFLIHKTATTKIPINAIDELSSPFEAIQSKAGLVVIVENERDFVEMFRISEHNDRLLNIYLERDLENPLELKAIFESIWAKFEERQKQMALPAEELLFLNSIAKRFEKIEALFRLTNLLTYKLDKSWLDSLVTEATPALLSIPKEQNWIIDNSKSLLKIYSCIQPYLSETPESLITSKDENTVIRASVLASKLFSLAKEGDIASIIESLSYGSSAFSPTIRKIIKAEKLNIMEILNQENIKKVA